MKKNIVSMRVNNVPSTVIHLNINSPSLSMYAMRISANIHKAIISAPTMRLRIFFFLYRLSKFFSSFSIFLSCSILSSISVLPIISLRVTPAGVRYLLPGKIL